MKGSIISGILLVVLVLLVIGNALYVHHVTHRLSVMTEGLPERLGEATREGTVERITKIQAYLKKHETVLAISVSYTSIDRMTELTAMLETYARMDADHDYTATRKLLIDAIGDAARLERLSAKNIF